MAPTGRKGVEGGDSGCDHRLQYPPCPSHLNQVTCEIPIGIGQRLAGGGAQPMEGATEAGATVQGIGKGGRGCPDVGKNLCGGGPGVYYVRVVDVVDDTAP